LAGVRTALEPLAVAHGVSLVDVIWTTERSGRTLRVTIERPGAGPITAGFGVTVDDCAEFSRDASAALDLVDGLDAAYCLEVSSPGLDRPLRSVEDFRRFTGELAKVKLLEPARDGQRLLRGTIESVTGEGASAHVRMLVDGKAHDIAYPAIESAQLTFELAHGEKKNTGGRTKKGARPKKSHAKSG
jgi:ribosome maturation factor RimP